MANSLNGNSAKAILEIDVSDVRKKSELLADALSPDVFNKAMRLTIIDTSKKVKTLAKEYVASEYQVGKNAVGKSFGAPIISTGTEISCLIPIRRTRGTIYSGASPASASYMALRRKSGPQAKILKAGASRLPHKKGSERIHFYVTGGELKGHVMVRHEDGKRWKGKRITPKGTETTVTRVGSLSHSVGISISQMPMNRAADKIQEQTVSYMTERLEHHVGRALNGDKI